MKNCREYIGKNKGIKIIMKQDNNQEIISLDKGILKSNYIIVNLDDSLSYIEKEKLLANGFIEGQSLEIIRKSLLGETYQVKIEKANLVIRKKDAKKIMIKLSAI